MFMRFHGGGIGHLDDRITCDVFHPLLEPEAPSSSHTDDNMDIEEASDVKNPVSLKVTEVKFTKKFTRNSQNN